MPPRTKKVEGVDLANGIIHGCLKQVRSSESNSTLVEPELITVWCCEIDPADTKVMVPLIRDHVLPYDQYPLAHLKRYQKVTNEEGLLKIQGIICTELYQHEKESLRRFVDEHTDNLEYKAYKTQVPLSIPQTREINDKWGTLYWPMNWKGNPNHQFLNSVQFNIEHERKIINELVTQTETSTPTKCSQLTTIFARPNENLKPDIICISKCDGSNNPYDHSIIKGIDQIAKLERSRRAVDSKVSANYLCHNLVVYTTDEPCVMCCMALVHSRVGRVIYLKNAASSGGFESNYQLGARDGLNWKFELWKWVGPDELERLEKCRPHYKTIDF